MTDHQRPLNARGFRDGPAMAKRLSVILPQVDVAHISSANRAQQTASFFFEEIQCENQLTYDKIYHASVDTLVGVIMDTDDDYETALLIGHNPGFSFLYNQFADESIDNLPTCGIFCLEIDAASWSDIDMTNTIATHLMYPKMYS